MYPAGSVPYLIEPPVAGLPGYLGDALPAGLHLPEDDLARPGIAGRWGLRPSDSAGRGTLPERSSLHETALTPYGSSYGRYRTRKWTSGRTDATGRSARVEGHADGPVPPGAPHDELAVHVLVRLAGADDGAHPIRVVHPVGVGLGDAVSAARPDAQGAGAEGSGFRLAGFDGDDVESAVAHHRRGSVGHRSRSLACRSEGVAVRAVEGPDLWMVGRSSTFRARRASWPDGDVAARVARATSGTVVHSYGATMYTGRSGGLGPVVRRVPERGTMRPAVRTGMLVALLAWGVALAGGCINEGKPDGAGGHGDVQAVDDTFIAGNHSQNDVPGQDSDEDGIKVLLSVVDGQDPGGEGSGVGHGAH